ncbi:MAG: GNAT family N-acetyltransferase, partial [Oscillospiraceae bacterium]
MNYTIQTNIKAQKNLRESFFDLAKKTFDLSFRNWYENGYWSENYIPYGIFDDKKILSNVSVNIIDTIWQGVSKRYIQIGTVMTDIEYRNKGLAKQLINYIIEQWKNSCDCIYLFANDSVLDFYPKFGFSKAIEHQYIMSIVPKPEKLKKLDMTDDKDIAILKQYYLKSNPFSALPMINNFGLIMFYCSSFLQNCVYYCEAFDAVVIISQEDKKLICYDIFCDNNKSMNNILSAIVNNETNNVILQFTPKNVSNSTPVV